MKKKNIVPESDRQLFNNAMLGVTRLKQRNTIEPHKKTPRKSLIEEYTPEPIEYHLSDAQEHHFVQSEDIINYASNGIQPRLLKKLQAGKLPIEGRLDLHGSRVEQARKQVSHFIHDSHLYNKKCVIIIHGKGTIDKTPVLKSMLKHWLQQIPIVLAFCSAQKKHGGSGAIYVLIKSNPHRNQ